MSRPGKTPIVILAGKKSFEAGAGAGQRIKERGKRLKDREKGISGWKSGGLKEFGK
jgi:hypothetical protein